MLSFVGLMSTGFAQASVREIQFDQEQRFRIQDIVAAGKSIEVCGDFAKGEVIAWDYVSDTPMDFNIHFHVGKKVNFPAKLKQSKQASGELKTKLMQTYCWMWTNHTTSENQLSLQLQRRSSRP